MLHTTAMVQVLITMLDTTAMVQVLIAIVHTTAMAQVLTAMLQARGLKLKYMTYASTISID